MDNELRKIFTADLTHGEIEVRYGEYRARLDMARTGRLVDGGEPLELRPVHQDPHMWELRWQWPNLLLRQYHAEPAHITGLLLVLKAHIKDVNLTPQKIKDAQNAQIREAVSRFVFGRSHGWGIY